MTELVYVPKRLVVAWINRGWEPVQPIDDRDYAVLMSPPKGKINAVKVEEAGKANGSGGAFALLCEKGGHPGEGGQGI